LKLFRVIALLFLAPSLLCFADDTLAGGFRLLVKVNSPQVKAFLHDLEEKLPDHLKATLHREIQIHFVDLNDLPEQEVFQCGQEGRSLRWAEVRKGFLQKHNRIQKIYLDNKIQKAIESGYNQEISKNCSHKSLRLFVESLIVHELAHLYDYSAKRVGINLLEEQRCRELVHDYEILKLPGMDFQEDIVPCKSFLISHQSVSDSPYLLNNLGWIEKGQFTYVQNLNQNQVRSPNPYEFASPKEGYAVNFEYFLLDPEFKCRRPTLYEYFSHIFAVKPHSEYPCKPILSFALKREQQLDASASLLNQLHIDPDRVYQIDYLFAGKGKQMISKWGHAMFRLVICKKGREMGPHCRYDYASHIVVSYRANMDELNIDYAKGMTGKYSSQLIVFDFAKIREEYTAGELRELISLPLNLSERQKRRFLYAVAEEFWKYRGKYYFISNNCATESMNLLKRAIFNNEFARMNVVTPLGLFDLLAKYKLIDPDLIANKQAAYRNGYYYAPAYLGLSKSYENLLYQAGSYDNKISLMQFVRDLQGRERQDLYVRALSNGKSLGYRDKTKILASISRIEEFVLQRNLLLLRKKIIAMLMQEEEDLDAKNGAALDSLIDRFQDIFTSSLPENMLREGYGIPTSREMQALRLGHLEEHYEEFAKLYNQLEQWAQRRFHAETEELQTTAKYLSEIKTEICYLNLPVDVCDAAKKPH